MQGAPSCLILNRQHCPVVRFNAARSKLSNSATAGTAAGALLPRGRINTQTKDHTVLERAQKHAGCAQPLLLDAYAGYSCPLRMMQTLRFFNFLKNLRELQGTAVSE